MSSNFMMRVIGITIMIQLGMALYEIEVHRLLGQEEGDTWLGSKVNQFTMVAAHYAGESLRRLAMIRFDEIDQQSLEDLFQRKPAGILVILPRNIEDKAQELVVWALIYEFIAPRVENMPMYFCWDDETISQIYEQSERKSESEVQFQVSSQEPKQLPQLTLEDVYGTFDDINAYYRQITPTLMIVVGGDTGFPSANLQIPLENQGFQLQLYFQLVKSLKHVYQTYQRRDANLLFYLSSSSSLGYDGLKQFFSKQENQKIADQIQNVLILDTIYSTGPFQLQIQASPFRAQEHNNELQNILNILTQNFKVQGLAVEKKTSTGSLIKNRDVNVYKLTSVPENKFPNILTNQPKQSFNMLKVHNALFQSLLQIAYSVNKGQNDQKSYEELLEWESDGEFLEGIYSFFNETVRHVTNIQRDTKYTQEITKLFNGLFKTTQKSAYLYKDRKYLTHPTVKANIIKYISAFLDLYLFVGVAVWLGVLFIFFKTFNLVPVKSHKLEARASQIKKRK